MASSNQLSPLMIACQNNNPDEIKTILDQDSVNKKKIKLNLFRFKD